MVMSLISNASTVGKSLIFGAEGSFTLGGIKVNFPGEVEMGFNFMGCREHLRKSNIFLRLFQTSVGYCLNNKVTAVALQIPLGTFAHEIGHALALKFLTQGSPIVTVAPNGFGGYADVHYEGNKRIHYWKVIDSSIYAAGPLASTAFSNCRLIAATALKDFLPKPLLYLLILGAVLRIGHELLYAYLSGFYKSEGDWGRIAQNDKTHLVIASVLLGLQAAFGLFLAVRLF
jgi:hypothetical protein